MSDPVGDLLRFDPLAAAERATASPYQDDPATAYLGLILADAHIQAKERALKATRDTWSGMAFDQHLAVFAAAGFEILLEEEFTGTEGAAERFVVLWHPGGVLGSCESYSRRNSTNASHIAYAWRPHDPENYWRLTSSGAMQQGVWHGDHDTREGLRHTLLTPWSHLGTYMEMKADWQAYLRSCRARFDRLPVAIRSAMGHGDG